MSSNNLTNLLRNSAAYLAVLLVVMLTAIGLSMHPASTRLPVIDSTQPPQNNPPAVALPEFVDRTLELGIFHEHSQESDSVSDIKDVLGAGLCIGDIDGDHLDDLVFTTGSGSTRTYGKPSWWLRHNSVVMYINRLTHFVESTQMFDLDFTAATMGCLLTDFDNDGFNDLLLTSVAGAHLFQNLSGKGFVKVKHFNPGNHQQWGTCATVTDINGDGLPDIYICHYLKYQKNQNTMELASGFSQRQQSRFDPRLFDGATNQLLVNKGGFSFTDQTDIYFSSPEQDRSLGALWLDVNRDQRTDLLVVNDAGSPNRLYLRNAQNRFVEAGNILSPFRLPGASHAAVNSVGELLISRPQGLGLTFLQNIHNPAPSTDSAWEAGLNSAENVNFNGWGINFADFNLDGSDDIFIAAGIRGPDGYAPERSLPQPNMLFVRRGKTFQQVDNIMAQRYIASSRSTGTTDLNLDGKPDLIIANNNAPAQVLINETAVQGHWIGLKAQGAGPHTFTVSQGDWQHTVRLGNRPLFLGSEQGFRILALPSAGDVTITATGKKRFRLSANTHYFYRDNTFTAIDGNRHKLNKDGEWTDIVSRPLFVQQAFVLNILNLPGAHARDKQPLLPAELLQIQQLIGASSHTPRLKRFITRQPRRSELLPLYLRLVNDADAEVSTQALEKIRQLESDLTTDFLLPGLASDNTGRICALAQLFSTWFHEEEAATKTKDLAVPLLMKLLARPDPQQVVCAARALAASEHLTATTALLSAYDKLADPAGKHAIISALGMIRQRQVQPFLLERLRRETEARPQVAITVALNRLTPRLGDEKLLELFARQPARSARTLDLIAELMLPEHRVHYSATTLERAMDILQRQGTPDRLRTLPSAGQLVLFDALKQQAPADAVAAGIHSEHPFLRQIALAMAPAAIEKDGQLAAALLASPQWQTLPQQLQTQALKHFSAAHLGEAIKNPVAARNSLESIGLMENDLATGFIQTIAKATPMSEALDVGACQSSPLNLSERDLQSVKNFSRSFSIPAALLTPVIAAREPRRDLAQWLRQSIEHSADSGRRFMRCLARIKLDIMPVKKISLAILSLPETFEPAKQNWLLYAQRDEALMRNGINTRLEKRDTEFTRRYLLHYPITDLPPQHIDILADYPAGSDFRLFAGLMRHPITFSQRTPP